MLFLVCLFVCGKLVRYSSTRHVFGVFVLCALFLSRERLFYSRVQLRTSRLRSYMKPGDRPRLYPNAARFIILPRRIHTVCGWRAPLHCAATAVRHRGDPERPGERVGAVLDANTDGRPLVQSPREHEPAEGERVHGGLPGKEPSRRV